MPKVLLIEDDGDLSALIMEYLEIEGIHCDNAITGIIGLKMAKQIDNIYDCIILDINLPLLDGLTLCKELRKNKIITPIIMLTARTKLDDKLNGFSSGADDYLCKPFDMKELIARIRALTRRNYSEDELRCADLVINPKCKSVMRGKKEIQLTQIEYKILQVLIAYSPQIISKQKIINEVWGEDAPETDSLKVHIHNLRKNIDKIGNKQLIKTIPGQGYQIRGD